MTDTEEFLARLARGETTRADCKMKRELQVQRCTRCHLVKPDSCFHRKGAKLQIVRAPRSSVQKLEYRRACAAAAKAVLPDLKLTKSGCASGGMTYSRLRAIQAERGCVQIAGWWVGDEKMSGQSEKRAPWCSSGRSGWATSAASCS